MRNSANVKGKVENLSFTLTDETGFRSVVRMADIVADQIVFDRGSGQVQVGHWSQLTCDKLGLRIEGSPIITGAAAYELTPIGNKAPTLIPGIERVIYNNPATIVFWDDGTKTIVKAQDGEPYEKEKGLAMAVAKRALGNQGNYYNIFSENL